MSDNNKNRSVVWTLEEDEILIDFVKNHEPLYNLKCKDYRKTQLKLNLWREIANMIENKTDVECSKRWTYVRDYYVRRKEKPGTGAPGEAARKRAEQLSFLDSYSSLKRSTITNMGNPEQNAQEIDEEEDLNYDLEKSTQEKTDSQTEKQLTEVIDADNDSNIGHARLKTPKRLKHAGTSEERLKLLKKIAEKSSHEEQDETDLFFASMAKIVKKLPEREQVYIRLQIGTMVGNAQLKCLQQQDSTGPSRSISACSSASDNYNPQNEASLSTLSSTPQPTLSDYCTSAVPLLLSPNDSENFLTLL